jgi:cytochrome oxidase Cu insertion factor (SCO1/SenC/PrrC family)
MNVGAGIQVEPHRRHFRRARIALALCMAALLGIGVGAGAHFLLAHHAPAAASRPGATELHGQASWQPGMRPAPAIRALRDQTGHPFSLGSLRGRTVAMTFFDSYCTQACPLEGRALAAAERSLPTPERPVLIVISVNPRDTPASTRGAASRWGLAQVAPWHWLRGTREHLARVWQDYHISVAPPRNGDIAHTEALYLIDRRGDERSGYLYPFAPRFVTGDLRTLANERRG